MSLLIRNHLLCPYSDCEAHERKNSLRIQIAVDEERNVKLSQSEKEAPNKTKLSYKYSKWERESNCPFCHRPITIVIDETHNGRNIYLKK